MKKGNVPGAQPREHETTKLYSIIAFDVNKRFVRVRTTIEGCVV